MSVSKKIIDGNAQPSQGNAIVGLGGARGLDAASKIDSSHVLNVDQFNVENIDDINASLGNSFLRRKGIARLYKNCLFAYSLRSLAGGGENVVRLRRASNDEQKDFSEADLTGSVEGAELVTDPDFDTGSFWSTTGGWSITGGQAVNSGTDGAVQLSGGIPIGEYVIATINVVACSNFADLKIRVGANTSYSLDSLGITTTGTYKIAAQTQNSALRINTTNSATATIEFFGCKEYTPTAAEQWVIDGIGVTTQSFAYVTTWYDQSGSGNDATQTVTSDQPLLIRAGVINTENGKPALEIDGTDDNLVVGTNLTDSQTDLYDLYFSWVCNLPQVSTSYLLDKRSVSGDRFILEGEIKSYNHNGSWRGAGFGARGGNQELLTWSLVTGGTETYNNSELMEDNLVFSGQVLNGEMRLFSNSFGSGQFASGTCQEIVCYNTDQRANRIAIEDDMNNYWQVYSDFDSYLLDQYPGSQMAFSLRDIRGAIDAPVVQLRRQGDSEERAFRAAELIGGFDESGDLINTGNWIFGTGWSFDSGLYICDGTQVALSGITQNGILTGSSSGYYKITFSIYQCSDYTGINVRFGYNGASVTLAAMGISGVGTYSVISTAPRNFFFINADAGVEVQLTISAVQYNPTEVEIWAHEVELPNSKATTNSNLYVSRWFDQSGYGNYAIQNTLANQPRLVRWGVTNLENSNPAIEFNGVDQWLDVDQFNVQGTQESVSAFNDCSFSFVASSAITSFSTSQYLFDTGSAERLGFFSSGSAYTTSAGNQGPYSNLFGYPYQRLATFEMKTSPEIYIDGSLRPDDGFSTLPAFNGLDPSLNSSTSIGSNYNSTGNFFQGNIQEIIFYPTEQSENRIGIERNIASYYDIWDAVTLRPLDSGQDLSSAVAAYSLRQLKASSACVWWSGNTNAGYVPFLWRANHFENGAVGGNTVVNSGFDTDTDWTKGTGWTISGGLASHASGTESLLTSTANPFSGFNHGDYYIVTIDISSTNGSTLSVEANGYNDQVSISTLATRVTMLGKYNAANTDDLSIRASSFNTCDINSITVRSYEPSEIEITVADDSSSEIRFGTGLVGLGNQQSGRGWLDQVGNNVANNQVFYNGAGAVTNRGPVFFNPESSTHGVQKPNYGFSQGSPVDNLNTFAAELVVTFNDSSEQEALVLSTTDYLYVGYKAATTNVLSNSYDASLTAMTDSAVTLGTNEFNLISAYTDSGDVKSYKNGSLFSGTSSTSSVTKATNSTNTGFNEVGFSAPGDCIIKEIIIFNTDESDNRATIQSNINNYYTIY